MDLFADDYEWDHDATFCLGCRGFPCIGFWPLGTTWDEAMKNKIEQDKASRDLEEFQNHHKDEYVARKKRTMAEKKVFENYWISTIPIQHSMQFPKEMNRGYGPPPPEPEYGWRNFRMRAFRPDMTPPEDVSPDDDAVPPAHQGVQEASSIDDDCLEKEILVAAIIAAQEDKKAAALEKEAAKVAELKTPEDGGEGPRSLNKNPVRHRRPFASKEILQPARSKKQPARDAVVVPRVCVDLHVCGHAFRFSASNIIIFCLLIACWRLAK
jgi:hypothetical protein